MTKLMLLLFTLPFVSASLAQAQTTTSTALTLSSASVPAKTAVTLTASVQAGGVPVSPGLVIFKDGKTVLGSAQIVASTGAASMKVILGLGAHQITANFAGTKTDAKSSSSAQTLTVTGQAATTTTIGSSGSPGNYTLTGTVTNSGPLAATGTVSFADQTNNNALGSAALGAATAAQTFQAQTPYGTGGGPDSVAVGDFNGDGIPDLAVASYSGNTVSVLLGKGDGTFQAQTTYGAGSGPAWVAVGDFNGDGIPDLAVANSGDNTVSVLLGKGDGTFQAQTPYGTGNYPFSVAVGDFNGDGIPDLAVADFYGNTVSVLLGKGDGTFQAQTTYRVGSYTSAVAVGDFNGDGIPDLAVANFNDNTVSVLLNSIAQTASATLPNTQVVGTGTHQVAANYGGDSYHQPSTSGSIALTATQSTITAGQPVTFTASLNVYGSGSLSAVGETVTFYNGAAVLGTGTINNQGQASLTTSALPVGPDTITAQYPGDTNFTASTSNSVTVTVNPGVDFTIAPLPPSETVSRGQIAGFLLQLQSVNGFNGNVTLSCSGGPSGSYCVDFPQTVHVNGRAYAATGVFFPKTTTPGTYTITITAVSGSLTHSTTAKFTVK